MLAANTVVWGRYGGVHYLCEKDICISLCYPLLMTYKLTVAGTSAMDNMASSFHTLKRHAKGVLGNPWGFYNEGTNKLVSSNYNGLYHKIKIL